MNWFWKRTRRFQKDELILNRKKCGTVRKIGDSGVSPLVFPFAYDCGESSEVSPLTVQH